MANTIITIWFFVLYIPGIYLFFKLMQCFDWEKVLKRGQTVNFRIFYMLLSIILSFLFAYAFTSVFERIYEFFSNMTK